MATLDFEGQPVPLEDGDTVASALFRAGVRTFNRSLKQHRRRGLYCVTGDCPNCLCTVDGEPGTRACTKEARDGMRVERETGWPSPDTDVLSVSELAHPLMPVGFYSKTFIRPRFAWETAEKVIRRATGAGRDRLETLAAEVRADPAITLLERRTAVGIYEGPMVPLAAATELLRVHPTRIVVATGAVETHGVFAGNDVPGVWLGRGAARMAGVHHVRPGVRAVVVAGTEDAFEHVEVLRAAGVEIAAIVAPEALAARAPSGVRVFRDGRI